ncbi:hypothetical protein BaOVIS_009990 [Babesia ovis]|uniref:Uncharacterized protein n=1 Tax=Babesia ovis TaxID=5869 RepID=A0A9W5WU47_BABOV|nr:hypothetical protein BaOVIS_009990 [Babesia ovis]
MRHKPSQEEVGDSQVCPTQPSPTSHATESARIKEVDDYTFVGNLLSIYGIDADGLCELFHRNKSDFATAIVDRFHTRDRLKQIVFHVEGDPLVTLDQIISLRNGPFDESSHDDLGTQGQNKLHDCCSTDGNSQVDTAVPNVDNSVEDTRNTGCTLSDTVYEAESHHSSDITTLTEVEPDNHRTESNYLCNQPSIHEDINTPKTDGSFLSFADTVSHVSAMSSDHKEAVQSGDDKPIEDNNYNIVVGESRLDQSVDDTKLPDDLQLDSEEVLIDQADSDVVIQPVVDDLITAHDSLPENLEINNDATSDVDNGSVQLEDDDKQSNDIEQTLDNIASGLDTKTQVENKTFIQCSTDGSSVEQPVPNLLWSSDSDMSPQKTSCGIPIENTTTPAESNTTKDITNLNIDPGMSLDGNHDADKSDFKEPDHEEHVDHDTPMDIDISTLDIPSPHSIENHVTYVSKLRNTPARLAKTASVKPVKGKVRQHRRLTHANNDVTDKKLPGNMQTTVSKARRGKPLKLSKDVSKQSHKATNADSAQVVPDTKDVSITESQESSCGNVGNSLRGSEACLFSGNQDEQNSSTCDIPQSEEHTVQPITNVVEGSNREAITASATISQDNPDVDAPETVTPVKTDVPDEMLKEQCELGVEVNVTITKGGKIDSPVEVSLIIPVEKLADTDTTGTSTELAALINATQDDTSVDTTSGELIHPHVDPRDVYIFEEPTEVCHPPSVVLSTQDMYYGTEVETNALVYPQNVVDSTSKDVLTSTPVYALSETQTTRHIDQRIQKDEQSSVAGGSGETSPKSNNQHVADHGDILDQPLSQIVQSTISSSFSEGDIDPVNIQQDYLLSTCYTPTDTPSPSKKQYSDGTQIQSCQSDESTDANIDPSESIDLSSSAQSNEDDNLDSVTVPDTIQKHTSECPSQANEAMDDVPMLDVMEQPGVLTNDTDSDPLMNDQVDTNLTGINSPHVAEQELPGYDNTADICRSMVHSQPELSRLSDVETLISMLSDVDVFKSNRHTVAQLIAGLSTQQQRTLKEHILSAMRVSNESSEELNGHLAFVLLAFLEVRQQDSTNLPLFIQLTNKLLKSLGDTSLDGDDCMIISLLLDAMVPLISKDLPFEAARALMDVCIDLGFRMTGKLLVLAQPVRMLLTVCVNRCSTLEEYTALVKMVTTRVENGCFHTNQITFLLLRLFELMLSSTHIPRCFHACKSAVASIVDASIHDNFSFLRSLIASLMQLHNNVVSHFCLLFISQVIIDRFGDNASSIVVKRRCVKALQLIASTVFSVFNNIEIGSGFLSEYVDCFNYSQSGLFKIGVFNLSQLEGCNEGDVISKNSMFDVDALRSVAQRYMDHLGVYTLHNAKICDLVLLLSIKHLARVQTTPNGLALKRRLDEPLYQTGMDNTSNKLRRTSFSNSHQSSVTGSVTAQLTNITNDSSKSYAKTVDQDSNTDISPCSTEADSHSLSQSGTNSDCHMDLDDISPQSAKWSDSGRFSNVDMPTEDSEDHLLRYARIVHRLFMATISQQQDSLLDPQLSQYLLLSRTTLSHMEDYKEAELCYKIVLYHIYYELYLGIWSTMTNVLYTSNDYSQLNSASCFLYSTITGRCEYMRYRVVRKLLVACLGDQCYAVRLSAVKLLAEVFKHYIPDMSTDKLLDKLLLSLRDINWKVRLAANTAVLHYLRQRGIDLGSMPVISAVAERSCDLDKEQPQVRESVLNNLAYSLFAKSHPFVEQPQAMCTRTIALADRFVKVILYKMSAFKTQDNYIQRIFEHFKQHYKTMEPGVDLSKDELRAAVDTHCKMALERWMNVLLDLFLLRRSERASFHVLAEIMCVLKLFGQADPEVFGTHLTYFLPYLKVDADEPLDPTKIDLVVLVCNLVSIASGYSTDLQKLEHQVLQLLTFDAPALTRAAIQLLVKLGTSDRHIESIFEESFGYLHQLHRLINTEANSHPADIVKVMSYNVLLRSAWKLGCVAEFADLTQVNNRGTTRAQKLLGLLLSLSNTFYDAGLYNVAGMIVQSIARIFVNLKNIIGLEVRTVRSLVRMFDQEAMVTSVMMVLYQLLTAFGKLSGPTGTEVAMTDMAILRATRNGIFCCLGTFVDTFVANITFATSVVTGANLVMTLEICNMVILNRLTNPEPMQTFLFCQVVSRESNTQRLAEQALKALARGEPEIFLSKIGTSFQTLLFSVIIGSFVQSIKARTQYTADLTSVNITDPCRPNGAINQNDSREPTVKEEFILGYGSELTTSRIRGIVRLFLEAVTTSKHIKKLLAAIVAQLSGVLTRDFRDTITDAVSQHGLGTDHLQQIHPPGNGRLSRLLSKHIKRACSGDPGAIADYFTLLYTDILATVLDHLTFRDASVARFLVKRLSHALKDGNCAVAEDVRRYRDSRLTALSTRIKQICA